MNIYKIITILLIPIIILTGCGNSNSTPIEDSAQIEDTPITNLNTPTTLSQRIDPDLEPAPTLKVKTIDEINVEKNSATIRWELTDAATGQVEYGTTDKYGMYTVKEESFKYDAHIQSLNNLEPNTTYYYRVISEDKYGNKVVSNKSTFTTPAESKPESLSSPIKLSESIVVSTPEPAVQSDPLPEPIIVSTPESTTSTVSTLKVKTIDEINVEKNSATILWELTDSATGQVEYGTTDKYGKYTVKEESFKYDVHIQSLNNLEPNTTYYYRVISEDKYGNKVVSNKSTFTTPAESKPESLSSPIKLSESIVVSTPEPAVQSDPLPEPIIVSTPEPTTSLVSLDLNNNLGKWAVVNAEYDPTQSYDKEPGSVKLTDKYPNYIISNVSIPVKAGEIYTLTARIKSDSEHKGLVSIKGAIKGGSGGSKNLFHTFASNSKPYIWEKVTSAIKIPDNTTHNQLYIKVVKESIIKGTVWVDNIQVTKGIQLGERPAKKVFNGSKVLIDTLGNVQVDGEPFFPISIFADGARDFNIYKNQGFNTIAWARSVGTYQRAKDAGMMANFEMAYYLSFKGAEPAESQSQLATALNSLKSAGLMDTMLFYYWDNEFYHFDKEVGEVSNIINTIDTVDGQRMHPNLMLAAHYGHTRIYDDFIDISGTYTGRDLTASSAVTYLGEPLIYNLQMQDFTENQDTPSSIGQFNAGVNERFRALIFGGIANGMKGFGYWRDSATGATNAGRVLDITKQVWWDDFPSITSEIQQMLDAGLIQASHLTGFTALSNKAVDKIISGTRLLNGNGYIIMGNTTDKDETVTFTLNNLGYNPTNVTNFFDGTTLGTVSGNTVTVTLPAYDSRVIKLEK